MVAHDTMRIRLAMLAAIAAVSSNASAQDATQTRMQAWSQALGVACVHCHVQDNWQDASKPAFEFAGRMSKMLDALNAGPLKIVEPITCWTCHRGRSIPSRLARETWENIRADHAAEFPDRPNRAIAMSVYAASLGVDCSHCHEADRALHTKVPKAMVPAMLAIFDEIPRHFDDARRPVTQCFMCHQGRIKPERSP
jgi:hypothetical protein